MQLHWEFLHPRCTIAHLGHIGALMRQDSTLTAAQQITRLYPFGGWNPTFRSKDSGCQLKHLGGGVMKYPGDPLQRPIAKAQLRDETIYVYDSEFWVIVQPDGSFEMARLD